MGMVSRGSKFTALLQVMNLSQKGMSVNYEIRLPVIFKIAGMHRGMRLVRSKHSLILLSSFELATRLDKWFTTLDISIFRIYDGYMRQARCCS